MLRISSKRFLAPLALIAMLIAPAGTIADEQAEIDARVLSIKRQYGVLVHYRYSPEDYFPERWRKAPILARGEQLSLEEVSRLLTIVDRFLSRYPKTVLDDNLDDIYLLARLDFFGKSYGATNSRSGLYIKSEGSNRGFSDRFLVQRMHSELSSILLRNHEFPERRWRAANPAGFRYLGKGRDMLGEADLYGESPRLLSQGFIVRYAQSSIENDFNMIAFRLFTDMDRLRQLSGMYPKIKSKMDLAIGFYKTIDSRFAF